MGSYCNFNLYDRDGDFSGYSALFSLLSHLCTEENNTLVLRSKNRR